MVYDDLPVVRVLRRMKLRDNTTGVLRHDRVVLVVINFIF